MNTLGAANDKMTTKGTHGFSLLEMLVALSIFSILSLIGMVVLRSYTDGQMSLKFADEQISQIQLVSNIVRDDLTAAIIRPVRGPLGGAGSYFKGGMQEPRFGAEQVPLLQFVRGGNRASEFDDTSTSIQSLEYWYANGNFIRRSYVKPDATEETPVVEQTLLDGLDNITTRFRVQGTWVDGLQSIAGSRQSLPELVEITFTFNNNETLTRLFTVGAGT